MQPLRAKATFFPPFRWMACGLCGALLAGCGGSELPQTVPVRGKVTFDGGACPNSGALYFNPVEAAPGFPMRPGIGDFARDGTFSVKSFEPGDGLVPGRYLVRVECWDNPPNWDGKPYKSLVPEKYDNAEKSGLEVKIEPGERARELTFDIITRGK